MNKKLAQTLRRMTTEYVELMEETLQKEQAGGMDLSGNIIAMHKAVTAIEMERTERRYIEWTEKQELEELQELERKMEQLAEDYLEAICRQMKEKRQKGEKPQDLMTEMREGLMGLNHLTGAMMKIDRLLKE